MGLLRNFFVVDLPRPFAGEGWGEGEILFVASATGRRPQLRPEEELLFPRCRGRDPSHVLLQGSLRIFLRSFFDLQNQPTSPNLYADFVNISSISCDANFYNSKLDSFKILVRI